MSDDVLPFPRRPRAEDYLIDMPGDAAVAAAAKAACERLAPLRGQRGLSAAVRAIETSLRRNCLWSEDRIAAFRAELRELMDISDALEAVRVAEIRKT